MYVGAALLGLAALLLIAQGAAWLLTEWRGPVVKIKPLNCRACMTFWLTALALFAALAVLGYDRAATQLITWHTQALVFAFINYFYINSKFKVYE